jgi:hypothetical protein
MNNNEALMTIEINRITLDEAIQPREERSDQVIEEGSRAEISWYVRSEKVSEKGLFKGAYNIINFPKPRSLLFIV